MFGGIFMRRRGLFSIILLVLFIFTGFGCAKKDTGYSGSAPQSTAREKASMDMAIADGTADNKTENARGEAQSDKKIITTSTLYIVEEDLAGLSKSIQKKAEELGGYIEGEELHEYNLTTRVRIPAAKFNDFISYAEKGFEVKSKSVSSENITDAYVDNEARLKNLKAQETQILEIMKKADKVEDVLKVQAELYKVRGEIESLEARKKTWDKQVDYTTITINADKKQIVGDNKKTIIGGNDFIKAIGKGFTNTSVSIVLFLQNLVIFILSNIIIIALLALAGVMGYRKYKKYSKK